ncbi:DUF6531 domain-containing protein [Streptomyces sp. NPDC000070]|uniref:DUF6531 domain-containing protein n=1 Tax=Streptomyces sp. NPDC000070 TaxID=3154240 RepID=UPI00331FAE90
MLAATDFDIAGVGQKLQLTRTYNSLEAPWGKVSQRWWQAYERHLRRAGPSGDRHRRTRHQHRLHLRQPRPCDEGVLHQRHGHLLL